jgi:hypothetical protein
MRTWAALLTAVALFLAAGCTSVGIDSIPQGAKVLVDGHWNGAVTPVNVPVRDLTRGTHTVTVEKEGYKTISPPPQVTISTDGRWVLMTCIPPAGPLLILPAELCGNLWKKAEDSHGQISFGQMCLPLDTFVLLKENPDAAPPEPNAVPARLIRSLGARNDPLDVPFSINVRDMGLAEAVAGIVAQVNGARLNSDIIKDGVLCFSAVEMTMDKDAVGRVTCNLPFTTFKAALDAFLLPNRCAWTYSKKQKDEKHPWQYIYKIRVSRDVERAEAAEISVMKPDLRKLLVAEESSLTVARWRNEMLADAKTQQLPALLRDSKTTELIDLAGKIEHTILDCARASEALKDQSQRAAEPAAQPGGPPEANEKRELSLALKQRIELLAPILDAINAEIANRSK